jgi:hypothetical protein
MFGKVAATEDYVLVEHPPVSELSDTLDRMQAVADLFRKGSPRRLLVDLRFIHPQWTPEEAGQIAETAQRLYPEDLRSAFLVSPGLRDERICRFIRLRRQWGAETKPFYSRGAALAWLKGEAREGVNCPDCTA